MNDDEIVPDACDRAMQQEHNVGMRHLVIKRIFKHHRGCEKPGATISDVVGKGASDVPIPPNDIRAYLSKMRYDGYVYFSSDHSVDVVPEGESVSSMEQAHYE